MELLAFLVQVFVISISGALAPGPVGATAITLGSTNKHAGSLLAFGHGIIEFPLIIFIMLGTKKLLETIAFKIVVGLAGGAILIVMAFGMFIAAKNVDPAKVKPRRGGPILAGVLLSASNPYFLLWWTTIGLGLASKSKEFGIWGLALFTIVHWFCDLFWLEALSLASFKGSTMLGQKQFGIVLKICAAAMFAFGLKFLYDASTALATLI